MDTEPSIRWAVAKVIREARTYAGFSQSQLADFSALSHPFVSSLERGRSGVSVTALIKIAAVLRLEAAELMRRIEKELKQGTPPPEQKPGRPKAPDKRNPSPAASKPIRPPS